MLGKPRPNIIILDKKGDVVGKLNKNKKGIPEISVLKPSRSAGRL